MNWEMQFKIAILERKPEKIIEAIENVPPIEDIKDLQEKQALYDYLEQGLEIIEEAKKEILEDMEKLKKVRAFLKTNPYGKDKALL